MLKFEVTRYVPNPATVCMASAREVLIVVVMLYGLAQGGECMAGEEPDLRKSVVAPGSRSDAPLVSQVTPDFPHVTPGFSHVAPEFDLGSLCLPEVPNYPSSQFSPRKHFAPDEPFEMAAPRADALRTATVWQRLNEYRSKDRVRLVTLWETTGSSVSLQAGRHGEPSLQWSSRALNRGGSTRGLLDNFVAASLGAAGIAITQPSGARAPANSSAGVTAVRPVRPATIATFTSHAP